MAVGRDRNTGNLLVLTAAHVVRDRDRGSKVSVYVADQWRPASVRALTQRNPNWDLALLDVPCSKSWPCLALAGPILGERVEVNLNGYEGGLRWVHKRGLLGHRDKYWLYWNDAVPREGTSGGAIVVQGALAAIITGYLTDGSNVGIGQNTDAIAMFLKEALGYIPGELSPPAVAQINTTPSAQAPPTASAPAPPPAGPLADPAKELRDQLVAIRQELDSVKNRPITVEIFDPATGQVKSRTFPSGTPIRLKLPEKEKTNAG